MGGKNLTDLTVRWGEGRREYRMEGRARTESWVGGV